MLLYAPLQLDKNFYQTGNPLWLTSMFKNLLISWANFPAWFVSFAPSPLVLGWLHHTLWCFRAAARVEWLKDKVGSDLKAGCAKASTYFLHFSTLRLCQEKKMNTSRTSSHLVSRLIQQGTKAAIKAFWSVEKFRFSSDSPWWSVSLWVCNLKVLCWPRILELCFHQTSCSDSMELLSGIHFVSWVCVHLHMCCVCVEGKKKRGMCSILRVSPGALVPIYLHYSCQSALHKARWAKWIFCSGANVIWKAGLCVQSVGGYIEMERVPVCGELSSSSLYLLLSPQLTLLYTAAKTPPDKTLT